MNPKQLEIWPRPEIEVYKNSGGYTATLAGGWWVGTGATPESAVKAVIRNYEKEAHLCSC